MNDLSALRTAWHLAQNRSIEALAVLLEKWRPIDHARYEDATRAERTAEMNYYRALAAGHKNDFYKNGRTKMANQSPE